MAKRRSRGAAAVPLPVETAPETPVAVAVMETPVETAAEMEVVTEVPAPVLETTAEPVAEPAAETKEKKSDWWNEDDPHWIEIKRKKAAGELKAHLVGVVRAHAEHKLEADEDQRWAIVRTLSDDEIWVEIAGCAWDMGAKNTMARAVNAHHRNGGGAW